MDCREMLSRSASSTFVQPRASRNSATQFFISSSEQRAADTPGSPGRRHAVWNPGHVELRKAEVLKNCIAGCPKRGNCRGGGERLQQTRAMIVIGTLHQMHDRNEDEEQPNGGRKSCEGANRGVLGGRYNINGEREQRQINDERDQNLDVVAPEPLSF